MNILLFSSQGDDELERIKREMFRKARKDFLTDDPVSVHLDIGVMRYHF